MNLYIKPFPKQRKGSELAMSNFETAPPWYKTPPEQMEHARRCWPGITLPKPPLTSFPRHGSNEVLLLHVPRPFDELWDHVVGPDGFSKWRYREVKTVKMNLVPGKRPLLRPAWLLFDPEANRGKTPEQALEISAGELASDEVLSALIQFPDWPLDWLNDGAAPNLAGYRIAVDDAKWWWWTPTFDYRGRELLLNLSASDLGGSEWASPTVREVR